jgi:hypothetical protein
MCIHERFAWIFFEFVMFPNDSVDAILAVHLSFLHDMINVPEGGYN